jgi:hypothetical protein
MDARTNPAGVDPGLDLLHSIELLGTGVVPLVKS